MIKKIQKKPKNLKKLKKLTVTQIKKRLDKAFSLWIRARDGYEVNGVLYNRCYTCNISRPVKELQCGHYVSRSNLSTRWYPDNARPQCLPCNVFKHGNMVEYAFLLEAETPGITVKLRQKGRQTKKWGYQELLDLLESYTQIPIVKDK